MSEEMTLKTIDYDEVVRQFEQLRGIDESVVNQKHREMAVFDIILNNAEATDEMISRVTQEDIEMAWDTMHGCASLEDAEDELTIEAYRDSIYQHVYARDLLEGIEGLSVVKPKVAFF